MSNIRGFTNTQKIKEEAANWLLLIENSSPLSSEQTQELREWVAISSVHRSVILRMSKTWSDMDVLSAMRIAPEHKTWSFISKIKSLLTGEVIDDSPSRGNSTSLRHFSLSAKLTTAAICLVVSLLAVNLAINETQKNQENYYATSIGEYQKHTLDDGSILWLNSNSQVRVDYTKDTRRIDLISGEAYFEVEKDPLRPFEVYSTNRLVRAVGTAFSVQKLKEHIEVIVSEGVVELVIVDDALILKPDDLYTSTSMKVTENETNSDNHNPMEQSQYIGKLTAGQSMSIPAISSAQIGSTEDHLVHLSSGEVSRKLSWTNGKLVFAGETLEEVITEISRYSSIKIDVPDPELRQLQIGGHFQIGNTDSLFNILESGFGLVVHKIDENHVELLTEKPKESL